MESYLPFTRCHGSSHIKKWNHDHLCPLWDPIKNKTKHVTILGKVNGDFPPPLFFLQFQIHRCSFRLVALSRLESLVHPTIWFTITGGVGERCIILKWIQQPWPEFELHLLILFFTFFFFTHLYIHLYKCMKKNYSEYIFEISLKS